MSNKTFFALLGSAISPYFVILATEEVGAWAGLVLFCLVVFLTWKYFKKADDI
jgi:hypothetical protein